MRIGVMVALALCTLGSMLCAVSRAQAETIYYVDPVAGNDANDGLSEASPLRTILAAAAKQPRLRGGDRLRLRADVVHPASVLPNTLAGDPGVPLIVEPYRGTKVVFDGGVREFHLAGAGKVAWEPVAGGHPDEWRTRTVFDGAAQGRVMYGQFLDTGYRLITYARIEDFRASNESLPGRGVPLSDPRPGAGPLENDPTRKIPWTYLGPGIHWVPENPADATGPGRVHIRLSATHLNVPGLQDYTGSTDPNQVALGLSPEHQVALTVGARNVELRYFVVRNGGERTLMVNKNALNVTFDHCEVYGARYGVMVAGNEADGPGGIRFRHCLFDGGLAPWTTRTDIKTNYYFLDESGNRGENNLGNKTHDSLGRVDRPGSEFAYCTFRRAHDALQIGGDDSSIHHSLFEDLNDEVLQFNGAANVRIYKNVIRQALHVLSFSLDQPGGPIYVYRNVIDQRLPTRGFRALPPDVPAPQVWRYGTDVKMGELAQGEPMPGVHIYQNTFVASHPDEKADRLTLLFANIEAAAGTPRVHLNNLRLGVNLDVPLSWAGAPTAARRSQGNLWHLYHHLDAPWFVWDGNGTTEKLDSLDLAQARGWELGSVAAEPRLLDFDDEIFDYGLYLGQVYPNNDFRPAPDSPAVRAGVLLPNELPDPDRPGGGTAPDIGALAFDAPPLEVGVDAAAVFPAPGVPVANAGPDQTLVDALGDGFETVRLNGTLSRDADGTLSAYAWMRDGLVLKSTPQAKVYLPEGDHYLRLRVTDAAGNSDTDGVRIRIEPPAPHGDNPLQCPGFEETPCGWQIANASLATGAGHSGKRALKLSGVRRPAVHQRIGVSPEVSYRVSVWAKRNSEAVVPAGVRAIFLDTTGRALEIDDLRFEIGTAYAYREGVVRAPAGATVLDLYLGAELQSGTVFFDDVRVLDANLLRNAGFETPAPSGQSEQSPHWRLDGAHVASDPAGVRSGVRAVALEGYPHQITQQTQVFKGGEHYRVSLWIKTSGLSAAPRLEVRFSDQSVAVFPIAVSEGAYSFVTQVLSVPAGVSSTTLRLYFPRDTTGVAYVDDLLVERVSAPGTTATSAAAAPLGSRSIEAPTDAAAASLVSRSIEAPADQELKPVKEIAPRLTWAVERRYEKGWDAYDPKTHRYAEDYVQATAVKVSFDLCASSGGEYPIASMEAVARDTESNATVFSRQLGTKCRFEARLGLKRHTVTLTVTNTEAQKKSQTFEVHPRDWLIVSIGDSMSSGEGNPDAPAVLEDRLWSPPSSPPNTPTMTPAEWCRSLDDNVYGQNELNVALDALPLSSSDLDVPMKQPAKWVDSRCHRSRTSGPALAAKAIEDRDPHSSVTYLNFACSGAELRDGILSGYSGKERRDESQLPPQIESVADAVGSRSIDALFVTAGINDLQFSTLVNHAAKQPFTLDVPGLNSLGIAPWKEDGESIVSDAADSLLRGWPELDSKLASLQIGEVYVLGYPFKILRNGAGQPQSCGLLGLTVVGGKLGITNEEIGWLEDSADALLLRETANWARVHQWNFVGGAQEEFTTHGYCAANANRYIVRFQESCLAQGDESGMLHPNLRGHQALASRLADAVHLGPTPQAFKEIVVEIESILIKDESAGAGDALRSMNFQFGIDTRQPTTMIQRFDVPVNKVFTPPSPMASKVRVWRAPTLPRLPTRANLVFSGIIPAAPPHAVALVAAPGSPSGEPDPADPSDRERSFGIGLILDPANNYGDSTQTQIARDSFYGGSVEVRYRITVKNVIPRRDVPALDPGGEFQR